VSAPPASLADAREQFLALVADVRPELHRYCARLVGSVIEGEDIVQEAFERVWTRASDWRPRQGARFFAWLARIALNLAIDRIRRPRQLRLEDTYDAPTRDPDAERCLLAREIGRRIASALEHLPERQRTAFALCQIERMSNAGAAGCLGISLGALELLLVRARKSIRRELADLIEGD